MCGRRMASQEVIGDEIGDDTVLRVVPDTSLAEDALLTGLELLERRAGVEAGSGEEAEFAQTRMCADWRWPTLITHYPSAATMVAIRAAAHEPVRVKDQNVAGELVDKEVRLTVVVLGSTGDDAALAAIAAGYGGGSGGLSRGPTPLS